MKNHMELSHISRKKLKNQANATGHKGAGPHSFNPPFFLCPVHHFPSSPLAWALTVIIKWPWNHSWHPLNLPVWSHLLPTLTPPMRLVNAFAPKKIYRPIRMMSWAQSPFSFFSLSQSHLLSLQMHELCSIHTSLNTNLSWATILSGNFFLNSTLLVRTLAIHSSITLLFMPFPLRILRESRRNPSHAFG